MATLGSTDVGYVMKESIKIDNPLIKFAEPNTETTAAASSETDTTQLIRFTKPVRSVDVQGVMVCANLSAATTFISAMEGKCGTADDGAEVTYTGITVTINGLVENLRLDLDVGKYRVNYSFTIVEGESVLETV